VSDPPASFYFDLSSPLAYLAAERVLRVLPGSAEWRPVLARDLPRGGPPGAFRCAQEEDVFRTEIARRARELELLPLRWPEPFPFDSELAMRVATYAKSIGRAVAFAQAAFRQAFAAGRSLEEADNVLIAAAACEMHPDAVLAASKLRTVTRELARSTAGAVESGVLEVPAVAVGERVFLGERSLEEASAYMARTGVGRTRVARTATGQGQAARCEGTRSRTPAAGR
jgi:2-hydroxychromene-2-carboxylate isomerase